MYNLINTYIKNNEEWISKMFGKNEHFELYINAKINKLSDEGFQKNYKHFWGMNPARLNEPFYNTYFQLLNERKFDLDFILCEIKSLQKGFQFSFITKLLHTIEPNPPIYDRMISQFYFLPDFQSVSKWEDKAMLAKSIYEFLQFEFQRIKDEKLLSESLEKLNLFLDEKGIEKDTISETKKIDSLIWAWVSFVSKGQFANKTVQWK